MVITEHRLTASHEFDWDNIKIFDSEPSYFKRLILEAFYINKQLLGLNLQSNIDLLDKIYLPLIERSEKIRLIESRDFLYPF